MDSPLSPVKTVADTLREKDVERPADGRECGEREAGGVEVAVPGFGELDHAEEGECRPGEGWGTGDRQEDERPDV
jgi:hypothetical protein